MQLSRSVASQMALIDQFYEGSRAVQLTGKKKIAKTLHGQLPVKHQHEFLSVWLRVHVHFRVHVRNGQGEATSHNQKRKRERHRGGRREWGGTRKDHKKAGRPQQRREREGRRRHEVRERKEIKRYLFWRPPSPPRSSEKFLRFHQHQLNHREKRQSPISIDRKKERERERERERETERETEREWQSSRAVSFSWPLI